MKVTETVDLSRSELAAFQMLVDAAAKGRSCPTNMDIETHLGFSSCSMGSTLVSQLERKGLITVTRTQRARVVTILATGQTTPWPEGAESRAVHIPRGAQR